MYINFGENDKTLFDPGPYKVGDYVTVVRDIEGNIAEGTVLQVRVVQHESPFPISSYRPGTNRTALFCAKEVRPATDEEVLIAKLSQ